MQLTINLSNEGDIVMVSSPEMRCEFPVRHSELEMRLNSLVSEWVALHRMDGNLPELTTE